jgi:hypothetical protein
MVAAGVYVFQRANVDHWKFVNTLEPFDYDSQLLDFGKFVSVSTGLVATGYESDTAHLKSGDVFNAGRKAQLLCTLCVG